MSVDLVLVRAEGEYLSQMPDGARLIDLNSHRTATSFLKLIRYLRRERPVVLLSTLAHANVVALMAKLLIGGSLRVVARMENTFSEMFDNGAFKQRQTLRLLKRLLPAADGIVAVSRGVSDDLCALIPAASHKIMTIYNPVVWPDHAEKAAAPVEHPWFNYKSAPVVLSAGRPDDRERPCHAAESLRGGPPLTTGTARDSRSGTGTRKPVGDGGASQGISTCGPSRIRDQPVRVHVQVQGVRSLLAVRRLPERLGSGDGVRDAGREHRLPQWAGRDTRRWEVGTSRAGGGLTQHGEGDTGDSGQPDPRGLPHFPGFGLLRGGFGGPLLGSPDGKLDMKIGSCPGPTLWIPAFVGMTVGSCSC